MTATAEQISALRKEVSGFVESAGYSTLLDLREMAFQHSGGDGLFGLETLPPEVQESLRRGLEQSKSATSGTPHAEVKARIAA